MPSYKAVWTGSRDILEPFETALSELYFPMPDACSLIKDEAAKEDTECEWSLHAYFQDPINETSLIEFAKAHAMLAEPVTEELPDQDWVAHALEGLGLVEAGDFLLYGTHDESRVDPNSPLIPIRIDANQAFGTGHHPTTEGCLRALSQLKEIKPANILDLGTGSAVLAIAARKIWPDAHIIASDIDEPSVYIAAENAALNEASNINCVLAAGFDHHDIQNQAPFDFIFANILAGPLAELAPDMQQHTQKNATVILAGLLAEQEDKVTQAYLEHGFKLENRLDHATWPVLFMKKL